MTKEAYMDLIRQMIKLAPFVVTISIINVFLQSCISHPNIANTRGFFAKLSKIIHLLALTMVVSMHDETSPRCVAIRRNY